MKPGKRLLQIAASFAAAAAFAGSAFYYDQHQAQQARLTESLHWARQISDELDGLILAARERGELDPVGWGVAQLSQGTEPRAFHLSRLQGATESQRLLWNEGAFEYIRDGAKIRIFFERPSLFQSDLKIALLFGLAFALLLQLSAASNASSTKRERRVRGKVSDWITTAQTMVKELGFAIREMVRDAHKMAKAVGRSRDSIATLRTRMSAQLAQTQETRLLLEAALKDAPKNLQSSIRGALVKVSRLQASLEIWGGDTEKSFAAYDDVFLATEHLNTSIKKTTEALIAQSKLIDNLNWELAPERLGDEVITRRGA